MFAQRVRPDEVIDLLAAESYDPVLMRYCGYTKASPKLSDFTTDKARLGVTGTIANAYVPEGSTAAIPYLTTKQVDGLYAHLDGCKYITADADQEWSHCRVPDGAIVLNKSGNVGAAAIVACAPYAYVNTVSDLINIRPRRLGTEGGGRGIDSGYLVVYLNSPYGQSQLQRLSGGAVFDHVSLFAVPEIRIHEPNPLAQRYIGDKVRQAERLRERARQLDAQGLAAMTHALGGSAEQWVANTGFAGVLASGGFRTRIKPTDIRGRIDPAGYHPELRAIVRRASQVGTLFRPLHDLADVATDARPLVSSSSGVDVYVSVLHVDERGFVDMTAASTHKPESNGRACRPGDVLLSGINPAANRIGVCGDFFGSGACSPEFTILESKPGVDPHYLAYVLRSFVCLRQLIHLGQGTSSSRRRVDESELANLWIPILEEADGIGQAIAIRQRCIAASQTLTWTAKRAVEQLVDGRLTEADLVAAQKALEGGDRSADREILKSLRESNAPDATPLIADVDALYSLLDGSEGQDA